MAYRESADPVADINQKHQDEALANEFRVWVSLGVSTALGAASALSFGTDPWRVVGSVAATWCVLIFGRAAVAMLNGGW